jgi:hypothetical protein
MRGRLRKAAFGPALLLASCAEEAAGPLTAPRVPIGAVAVSLVPFDSALRDFRFFSGLESAQRLVVRDEAAWNALWRRIAAPVDPMPPVPQVDFASSMVVLAAMGVRPSTGYSISITGVFRESGRLYVEVLELSPGQDCVTGAALTAPLTAVLVPRGGDTPVYVEREETYSCG